MLATRISSRSTASASARLAPASGLSCLTLMLLAGSVAGCAGIDRIRRVEVSGRIELRSRSGPVPLREVHVQWPADLGGQRRVVAVSDDGAFKAVATTVSSELWFLLPSISPTTWFRSGLSPEGLQLTCIAVDNRVVRVFRFGAEGKGLVSSSGSVELVSHGGANEASSTRSGRYEKAESSYSHCRFTCILREEVDSAE
jgi:hypothetical protein